MQKLVFSSGRLEIQKVLGHPTKKIFIFTFRRARVSGSYTKLACQCHSVPPTTVRLNTLPALAELTDNCAPNSASEHLSPYLRSNITGGLSQNTQTNAAETLSSWLISISLSSGEKFQNKSRL